MANYDEFAEMLARTLEDERLSRGERRALDQTLEELAPGPEKLAYYRNRAFDLARKAIDGGNAAHVLGWLEKVNKLLLPDVALEPSAEAAAYFSPADDCPARIGRLFAEAQRQVDVCVFTITDNRISREIIEASRRGLEVRVISDNDKSEDLGSDIDRLADRGVDVRVDSSPYHMHHKFALFDRSLLLTGSYNWTRGAAEQNEENFILTSDTGLIRRFSSTFESLWEQFG